MSHDGGGQVLIDISTSVHPGMTVWPGDPAPELVWETRIEDGETASLSTWRLGSHTGTHVDAPSHFIVDGPHIDAVPLGSLVGECIVLDIAGPAVTAASLEAASGWSTVTTRVLLRTENSRRADEGFRRDFVAVELDAARLLVERGVVCVGVDGPSVERFVDEAAEPEYDYPVHRHLLASGVALIEGLDLASVTPGPYRLTCLPLKTLAVEASPARAILETLIPTTAKGATR